MIYHKEGQAPQYIQDCKPTRPEIQSPKRMYQRRKLNGREMDAKSKIGVRKEAKFLFRLWDGVVEFLRRDN
jgi:hypothetical protein